MKKLSVAVIASSGGGAATLGHTDPQALLQTLDEQLGLCVARVTAALFVALDGGKGMDSADPQSDLATLYQVDLLTERDTVALPSSLACTVIQRGTLAHVNQYCLELEEKISQAIEADHIHGLICISCHVGIFHRTLQAAAKKKIPVTGSGGTSLSRVASLYNICLVGNAGGSVATTSFTRAVSYTHALSVHWKRSYQPWKESSDKHRIQGPSFTSVLNACLPAFWGVCIAKSILRSIFLLPQSFDLDLEGLVLEKLVPVLENYALPTACASIMATSSGSSSQRQTPTSSLIMASIIASMSCSQSILSGLLAGWIVSFVTNRLIFWCIFRNIPATMTNMLTAGGVGALVLLILLPIAPLLRLLTLSLRTLILFSVTFSDPRRRALFGFAWGCLSCYGSKVGWYHAFFLPAILIEMELGDPSFLGAIDELTLVLVCAGICLGNLISRNLVKKQTEVTNSDAALCQRGLYVNLFCGDFVEVCYPFMERYPLINMGGYLASGMSAAWLVVEADETSAVPRSLAYVPWVASVALSGNQWFRMVGSSFVAVGVSCLATLLQHGVSSVKKRQ